MTEVLSGTLKSLGMMFYIVDPREYMYPESTDASAVCVINSADG